MCVNLKMKEKLQWPETLRLLMRKQGIKALPLSKAINISHVAIGNFLDGQLPKSEHLISLADFFSITTDALLGRIVEKTILTPEQVIALHDEAPRTVKSSMESHRQIELTDALKAVKLLKSKVSDMHIELKQLEECISNAIQLE